MNTPTLYLHTSSPAQLEDTIQLSARGYDVLSIVDVHRLLVRMKHPLTPMNIQWAVSHTMLLAHFSVLHSDIDTTNAVRCIEHARTVGQQSILMDDLPLTSSQFNDEVLDANDLSYQTASPSRTLRGVLRFAVAQAVRFQTWADAKLGDSLKNPMTRDQQRKRNTPDIIKHQL